MKLLCPFLKSCFALGILLISTFTAHAKPIWKFSVVVAVEKRTADAYEAALSKPIEQLVREQLTTVNSNFNRSDRFNGIYDFQADSIYVFSGPAQTEVFRPHPNYTYGLVINGFSDNAIGGGWLGSNQTIYHSWPWNPVLASGPFGPGATDGLTHEFAHARGAVDIYGMRVEGAKNPVNGQTFEPVNSIMNFPYGNIVWDEYTSNLLNSTGPGPGRIVGEDWITKPFPSTITLRAVDADGRPIAGATVELYPMEWFSYALNATPILQGSTRNNGIYLFTNNPYRPGSIGYPWHMRYPNFLVKATYNGTVAYRWLPLYEVQNSYFRHGAETLFTADIQFPMRVSGMTLTAINKTVFQPGDTVSVAFSTPEQFAPGNIFRLWVVDANNNQYEIGTAQEQGGTTIKGIIPRLGVPGSANAYQIRVTATDPAGQSDEYTITIRSSAPRLTLGVPAYDCATGRIWFITRGGDGTPITFVAPGITRTSPTIPFGTVESELRADPKVLIIQAFQSGQTATIQFDFGRYCQPMVPLMLTMPNYDCATGAIHFNTRGGDGTPIEFMAPGITPWTTNPNQFVDRESRTADDIQPFTLTARQSGVYTTYRWDLKATCGRARLGVSEPHTDLTLEVLGNPVEEQLRVLVKGAGGHPVQLWLSDLQGRVLESRRIPPAAVDQEQHFWLGQAVPAVLVLRAATISGRQSVKVIKQ